MSKLNPREFYAENVTEQLRRWDAGETIWTLELGGLGPGYEQAIQIAAIECARAAKDLTGMKNGDKESTDKFRAKCDEALMRIDKDLGGLTGAMAGAAQWLAWQWCFNGGPEALIERTKKRGEEKRIIQVSKAFPKVPTAA